MPRFLLAIEIRPEAALCTLTVKSAGDIGCWWRHIWSSRPIIVAASPIAEPTIVATVPPSTFAIAIASAVTSASARPSWPARRRLTRSRELPSGFWAASSGVPASQLCAFGNVGCHMPTPRMATRGNLTTPPAAR